jgi:hypothetical protein
MDKFITNIVVSSKLYKRCPKCKLERDIIEFHGKIKLQTKTCYNCNLRAIKYKNRKK